LLRCFDVLIYLTTAVCTITTGHCSAVAPTGVIAALTRCWKQDKQLLQCRTNSCRWCICVRTNNDNKCCCRVVSWCERMQLFETNIFVQTNWHNTALAKVQQQVLLSCCFLRRCVLLQNNGCVERRQQSNHYFWYLQEEKLWYSFRTVRQGNVSCKGWWRYYGTQKSLVDFYQAHESFRCWYIKQQQHNGRLIWWDNETSYFWNYGNAYQFKQAWGYCEKL